MATKIGILGAGKMGEALISGLLGSGGPERWKIMASTRSEGSLKELLSRWKDIQCTLSNEEVVRDSEIIILCVKPHQAKKVLTAVTDQLGAGKVLISICASITNEQLSEWTGGKVPVIRAMPNTPCMLRKGMTVLAPGNGVEQPQINAATTIFDTVGKTAVIEEHLMDGATGLSGCGPAYVYLMIEALSEAGVKVGLPRKTATLLAAQTLSGAAEMVLARGQHPAALKDEVTTPAGCTIDGLMALEEGRMRITLINAVLAAAARSKTLRG